ncbi:MAG: protein kinase [Pyrinomonadaceae bacterium]
MDDSAPESISDDFQAAEDDAAAGTGIAAEEAAELNAPEEEGPIEAHAAEASIDDGTEAAADDDKAEVAADEATGLPFEETIAMASFEVPIEVEEPGPEASDEQIEASEAEPRSADGEKIDINDFEASTSSISSENNERVAETIQAGSVDTDGKRPGLKPLAEGTTLNGRYEIVRKIGGGGMGAVYLAKDLNLGGVERAVKEMVQSSIEEEQQKKAIEDFRRESMILSTLDHPSIPTIYDYFYDEFEGRFYLVMKYISGGDLASRLRAAPGGRIEELTVAEWALQITDVLAYLHGLPTTIVYRDLKPSNVMLDGKTSRVMLIDFGIARSINQAQEKGVTAVGTMGYAPPELFSGQVEPRSDIYSLGSTMFHLLTGADPQNNPLLIFDFQKNPRPRQINPQLSDQMERILMRSVEYSAESRFHSAEEMSEVLAAHIDNLKTGNITYGVSEAPAAVSLANQSVFCGFCGQRIVATDLFCAFCGAKQPIAQQGVHAEIYPRSAATAKLIIDGTSDLDAPAFTLEKNENLLGRRDPMSNIFPEVDLSKYDPQTKISRRHARIWREGGNFMVEDLGSSNGTILIGGISDTIRLQPRQPRPLANGDRLRLGDTTLHFLTQ